MKRLGLLALTLVLILSGCARAPSRNVELALGDIPFTWSVPKNISSHLTIETPSNEYSQYATDAGAIAQTLVYYTPDSGNRTIFMGLYYFPSARFNAASRPDEPPSFGSKVVESDGMILSAAGPQDSIYDPSTRDGKNITELYKNVYTAESYTATKGK